MHEILKGKKVKGIAFTEKAADKAKEQMMFI